MNERAYITTLPITPVDNPGIGLMIIPFVMNILSKRLSIDKILSLNVNGMKLSKKNAEDCVDLYIKANQELGLSNFSIWRDNNEQNVFWVNYFFEQLKQMNFITKEKVEIKKCKCGIVEYLVSAKNISIGKKLYRNDQGEEFCNFCNSKLKSALEFVYLFRFPDIKQDIKVFPRFYEKELLSMADKFVNCKFLISRSRSSAFVIKSLSEDILLDVDFVWQMYLSVLIKQKYDVQVLVGSSKNILACCFIVAMLKLLNNKKIFLVIPPYCVAPEKVKLKGEKYLWSNLINKYDSKTIRIFLSTALNWKKKESALNFELLNLISKMSYRINTEINEYTSMENAIENLDVLKIKQILSEVRRNINKIFFYKEFFGII